MTAHAEGSEFAVSTEDWDWWRYYWNPLKYFGHIMRRLRLLSSEWLALILDTAVTAGKLSVTEADEIKGADFIFRGRRIDDDTAAYLVVEVSGRVAPPDVLRASHRAMLLGRAGTAALAVVAGKEFTPEAEMTAEQLGVWRLSSGWTREPQQ